jgi:hypothetical protein
MQKRLSCVGVVLTAAVVVFVTMAAPSARGPVMASAGSAAWSSPRTAAVPTPPDCAEMCGGEVSCGEGPCHYGSDMTCGEYAVLTHTASCVGCASLCSPYGPCEDECLEPWEVTTCGEAQYECGEPPPENCSSVCDESTVPCPTACWNGSSASTCVAENYDCGHPCWTPVWEYAGVVEDNVRWEDGAWVVDCYAKTIEYEWDFCNNYGYKDLQCGSDELLEVSAPQFSCCGTYPWYGGCGNQFGC